MTADGGAAGGGTVERLDPERATDAELAAAYAVALACQRQLGGTDLMRTEAETASWIRHPPDFEWRGHWVARHGDTVTGCASLGVPTGASDGAATAQLYELLVAPDWRGRGLGRALLDVVRAEAVARRVGTLWGGFVEPAGERFVRAVEGRTGNRQRLAALRLPAELPAAAAPTGYRLRSWVVRTPDELIASYARARNAINDAPHDVAAGTERWTPDRLRDLEAALARRPQQARVTVALDGAGEVAGYTELRLGPEPGAVARTEDTAVVAAHRGRGLSRPIKLESLRRLAADRPDVTAVTTGNDVTNAPMLAVNAALGFTEVAVRTDAFLTLTG